MTLDPNLIKAVAANRERTDTLLVGIVRTVHPSPGMWSGLAEVFQDVTYDAKAFATRLLRVPRPQQLRVHHLLVAQSVTADPEQPRLNPRLFAPGAELLLYLVHRKDQWFTLDENYGVVPVTPEVLKLVEGVAWK